MRHSAAVVSCAALALTLALPSLSEDKDAEVHECPFCHQDIEIANSPEGAWMKTKIAVASESYGLLKDSVIGYDLAERADAGAIQRTLNAQLVKVEEDGDAAVLVLQMGQNTVDIPALKVEGRWKLDLREIREQQTLQLCRANLQQLGQRIKRYAQTMKKAPRSGEDLWTDLRAADLAEPRLLVCPKEPRKLQADELEKNDWSRVSYRVTRDPLTDNLPAMKPLVWEKQPGHNGKRAVLYASGAVAELDQAAFDAAIERWEGASR